MSAHNLTPSKRRVDELYERGFTHSFVLDDETVIDVDDRTHYVPEQMVVLEEHREEGMSNPSDEAVVLALRAPDGVRGTMVTAYGPDNEHPDALRRLGRPDADG